MIGIIILNYNTWAESKVCIESIRKTIQDDEYRIYLVDNCSAKKQTEVEAKYFSQVESLRIIYANENRGYAAGNNIGMQAALQDGCEYFLISNSDILFGDNTISSMCKFLDANENVGIVAPVLYQEDGQLQPISMLEKFTLSMKYQLLLNKLSKGLLFRKTKERFSIVKLETKDPFRVFAVSGACFMFSRKCVEKVCPLDEHTFLYYEEYILGCHMEGEGLQTYILPEVNCIHKHGVSTSGVKEFSYTCLVQSEMYYCGKYLKKKKWQLMPLLWLRTIVYGKEYGWRGMRKFYDKCNYTGL